jgi:hypothetical protein
MGWAALALIGAATWARRLGGLQRTGGMTGVRRSVGERIWR